MLFEQLVQRTEQEPEYDWDAYYHWLYSEMAGHEILDFKFWICRKCMTVNVIFSPARYGKCRDCNLIYMA